MNIAQAAERFGVSRRTIERWIHDGLLTATSGHGDRREKLVHPVDVASVVAERPGLRRKTRKMSAPHESPKAPTPDLGDKVAPDEPTYQEVIDQTLILVYNHIFRMITQVCPDMLQTQTLETLRSSPFGLDLHHLARIARGDVREPTERVREAVESVVQLLFWPSAADDYNVPRSFWDTDLGRMLGLAKYRSYDPADLMSIGLVAQTLGVTRSTVYRWLDDRTFNYVHDDMTGRVFIPRQDVENLKRVVAALSDRTPEESNGDVHANAARTLSYTAGPSGNPPADRPTPTS